MKAIQNWRYCVLILLLGVGIVALLRACGEPDAGMSFTEYILQVLLSLSMSAACFGLFAYLTKKWECKAKIFNDD